MKNISESEFIRREDGLYCCGNKILDFVPAIRKVVEEITEGRRQMTYVVEILRNDQVVDTLIISNLFVKSWFKYSVYCPDAALSEKNRKQIQYFLEQQVADIPVTCKILIKQTGWQKFGGEFLYCGNRVVISGITKHTQIEVENKALIYCDGYQPDIKNSTNLCSELMEVHSGVSWILFLISFLDILKKLFRHAGYPLEFIFNLYGKSGSGKTALTKIECHLMQIFSFRSAMRRDVLLKELQQFRGGTVLVDDYHPAENASDRNRQSGIKDALVRFVEENPDAPNIIITSEYLEGHLSLQDREFQIFLDEGTDWKILSTLEKRKDDLEKMRTAFYVQIVAHAEEIVADIKQFCQLVDKTRNQNQDYIFRISRYSQYICCIQYLFQKYFAEHYRISICRCNIENLVGSQLERQIQHMARIHSMERQHTYLIAVRDMLKEADILTQINDLKEFIPNADTKHVDSRGRVSLAPKALLRGMMIYLQTQDIPIKKIVNELKLAEVLITYPNSKELTKIHHEKRYYQIDTEALNEYCSFFE